MNAAKPSFDIKYLAESREFKDFCDVVGQLTKMPIGLRTRHGKLFLRLNKTNYNPFCHMIQSSHEGLQACLDCNRTSMNLALKEKQARHYTCHAGLIDFTVPIFVDNHCVAFILSGQMLPAPPDPAGFNEIYARISHLPIDKKQAREAYYASHYEPPETLQAILKLLSSFAHLFCEVGYRLYSPGADKTPLAITKARNYLKEHFREPVTRDIVAQYVGLSESYGSRLVCQVEGVSFTKSLNRARIDHARKLLTKTDWPVTKICYESGYNSIPHFNRQFRKTQGCSPSEFRRQILLTANPVM